jgi:hypothetical protein
LCGITEAYNSIKEGILVAPFGPKLNCPTSYQYHLVSVHGRELSKLQDQFQSWVILSKLQDQFQSWVIKIANEFRTEVNEFISNN